MFQRRDPTKPCWKVEKIEAHLLEQALRGGDHKRLAEFTVDLSSQQVEVVGGGRNIAHLPIRGLNPNPKVNSRWIFQFQVYYYQISLVLQNSKTEYYTGKTVLDFVNFLKTSPNMECGYIQMGIREWIGFL